MVETSNTAQTATDIYTMLAAGGFKVLVACEESQTVCKAFRALGIEAYSCDIQEPSGGHPEWHIQGDAVKEAYSGKYDLMIAHPPCTYMSKAGARWMYPTAGNLSKERFELAMEAKDTLSEETKEKMRLAKIGKKQSKEHLENRKNALKNAKYQGRTILNVETNETFNSISEAARFYKMDIATLNKKLNGKIENNTKLIIK